MITHVKPQKRTIVFVGVVAAVEVEHTWKRALGMPYVVSPGYRTTGLPLHGDLTGIKG